MRPSFRHFLKSTRAAALIELALALPVLLTFLAGTVEVGFYLMLNQKLQHTAVALSDLTTRDEEISEGVLTDIFNAAPQIMDPFGMGERSRVFISAAGLSDDGDETVFWQRTGAGSLAQASGVGTAGGTPTLPGDLPMRENETIVVTEVFYRYEPIFFSMVGDKVLRRTAFFRPRIGALREVE